MRRRTNHKPLGTMTLILTAGIFLIMLTVMTLQGFLMYLYWRIFLSLIHISEPTRP